MGVESVVKERENGVTACDYESPPNFGHSATSTGSQITKE